MPRKLRYHPDGTPYLRTTVSHDLTYKRLVHCFACVLVWCEEDPLVDRPPPTRDGIFDSVRQVLYLNGSEGMKQSCPDGYEDLRPVAEKAVRVLIPEVAPEEKGSALE
jgi:hypothetical protein